jgi:hypothetical protein
VANGYDKKRIERWFLDEARRKSALIPDGEITAFEEPDFKIETRNGTLGIEVTELLRIGTGSIRPVALAKVHSEVVAIAEKEYYETPNSVPIGVVVYFWDADGGRRDKRKSAAALVDFVKAHRSEANPFVTFSRRAALPDGYGVISIDSTPAAWVCGESGAFTAPEIYEQLASRVTAKNKLLPTYRRRLPNAPIWLLIYSAITVSRGLSIPHGISDWRPTFDFEKVLFFSSLDKSVVEITKSD